MNFQKELNDIINKLEKDFNILKDTFIFKEICEIEKDWMADPLEKVHIFLKENEEIEKFETFIYKLRDSSYVFTSKDIDVLEYFTGKVNTFVKIVNWLNNFKNSNTLDLVKLFNEMKNKNYYNDLDVNILKEKRLKPFLTYLYSVVKHFQKPNEYLINYVFWQNIASKILKVDKDYDALCKLYRSITIVDNRHLYFAAYMGTLGKNLANEIKNKYLVKSKEDKNYKKLEKILNLPDYLNSSICNSNNDEDEKPVIEEKKDEEMQQEIKQSLNQILYGSPGTGKTYHTIDKALEIIFENEDDRKKEFDFKIKDEDGKVQEPTKKTYNDILKLEKVEKRKHLKGLFEYFKDEQRGQIEFVTFHQSYGYEEFVEGIKAETKDKDISYEIKAGIFKSLVEKSLSKGELASSNEKISEKNVIWKMSLGDSQSGEDKEYFDEAIKTNCLIMGYGGDEDFTSFLKKENFQDKNIDKTTIDMLDRFKNQMKKGDIVIISDGNRKFKAIAIVEGDYFYDTESIYKQKRKIKWLQRFTISRDVKEISEKNFTQVTLNKPQWINLDKLNSLISNDKQADNTTKNYVLIIDEINRGNISKIFGELITLIEPSKRIGAEEEIRVKLPYSGDSEEPFGVPQNLYIIGTMNTADRSIALMDTALRRRFHFEEMMPNPEELNDLEELKISFFKEGSIDKINIKELLKKINQRIEYLYDRDHTIGHAYFMSLKDEKITDKKAELDNIFRNKIIPLLQEYFYDDWEKIQIVLGDHPEQFKNKNIKKDFEFHQFVKSEEMKSEKILGFDYQDVDNIIYEFNVNNYFSSYAYKKIYDEYESILGHIKNFESLKED